MKRVAVYRAELLPLSETFVRLQAKSLCHWTPILVGRQKATNGLSLDGFEQLMLPVGRNVLARLAERLRERRWAPDSATVRALQSLRVQLVHAHFGPDAVEIWPSAHAAGLPLLVTLHGYDISIHRQWWESGCGGKRLRSYPARLSQLAHERSVHFIAVSNSVKQRAIDFGIPAAKLTVNYLGVDTAAFKPADMPARPRSKRILFVGRMIEKKAPLTLIRAFGAVYRSLPDAELLMIGGGPLLDSARRVARESGVPVSFLGPLASEQVIAQLARSAVFCLPSVVADNGDSEGLPISILEAMASGLPVVTSAPGAEEALCSELTRTGLFEAGDQRSLELALVHMLSNDHEAAAISREGRRIAVERFDSIRCAQELETVYDALVARRHG